MKIRLILAAIGLIFVAAACAPEVELISDDYLQDTSLISEDPCGAPCWRGITPGETSWNEALNIIEEDETLSDLQTRTDEDTGQIGAAWSQADGNNCCQMFTQDGSTVSLLVAQTAPTYTYADIQEKYGEPSYLIGESVSGDQALVSVYYPDNNFLIYLFVPGEDGEITEASEVIGFAYTSPDVMDLIVQTSSLYEWEGTGQVLSTYLDAEANPYDVTPSITLTPVGDDE